MEILKSFKLDPKRPIEALPRASNPNKKTTLLVHPFTRDSNQKEKPKTYLLETPKDLKRRTPLLELPASYKKPKLFVEEKKDNEMTAVKDCQTESVKSKCHCCCKCSKDDSEVKVIIAPAMIPSIYGGVPGIPYILKSNVEKVSLVSKSDL